ncbi:MAG: 50S ribosomal protein L21 [Alphaproteobacteria bacterium]|nr:50S ribosomal protein L21 [Alphaproteobacteria bacterium]
MFAIIKTGGKQYKVAANDIIRIEKLVAASGDVVEFTEILMMGQGNSVKVGAPFVANAKVSATVIDQIRDDKVIVFKKKRRHNYRRKNGHRQYLTIVKITDILADGATSKVKPSSEKAKVLMEEKKEASKEATKKASPKTEAKTAGLVKKVEPKSKIKAEPSVKKSASKAKKTAKE